MLHETAIAILADIRAIRQRIEAELRLPVHRREDRRNDLQLQSLLRQAKRQEREARNMVP